MDLNQIEPTMGIITALPKEFAAVKVLLKNCVEHDVDRTGGASKYVLGDIKSIHGGTHKCVITMSSVGNNMAATRATLLLEHFPSVNSIIMVGIAGGVPNPGHVDEHVRLGDIVVSNEKGVIQYDFDKETIEDTSFRNPPRPPSAKLIEAVRFLEAYEYENKRPWIKYIKMGMDTLQVKMPANDTDNLTSTLDLTKTIDHPLDSKRIGNNPRLFIGTIASANKLLKNPVKRDKLRDLFGVKAIEMEGSGIADATWVNNTGYLVIRGVCDYCDKNKGDEWQTYAAIVAAAFTVALIESIKGNEKKK